MKGLSEELPDIVQRLHELEDAEGELALEALEEGQTCTYEYRKNQAHRYAQVIDWLLWQRESALKGKGGKND